MGSYDRYRQARDTAWRALLLLEEKRLPVDVEALARQAGIDIAPYPASDREPRLYAMAQKAGGGACVSLRFQGGWHIFLREMDAAHRRFSIAHELGHVFLEHQTVSIARGVRAFLGRENAGDLMDDPESPEDRDADTFAIRLLSPACLLHELHVDTPGGINRLCGLPPRAAAARAERMELLNQRDAFFTHPLETQVRDAFLPFLREKAALNPGTPVRAPIRPLMIAPVKRPEGGEDREAPAGETTEPGERKRPGARLLWPLALGALAAAATLFFILRP